MRAAQPTHLIRVIVVDNSAIHSELLSEAIGRDRHFMVVGSTTSSAEVRQLVRQIVPDILLISSSLDDNPVGGLDVLAEFRALHPGLKSVVLLESPKREIIIEAFRLGGTGRVLQKLARQGTTEMHQLRAAGSNMGQQSGAWISARSIGRSARSASS